MIAMENCADATSLLTSFDAATAAMGSIGLVGAEYSVERLEENLLYSTLPHIFGPLAQANPQWYADDPVIARIAQGELRPFNFVEMWTDALQTAAPRIDDMRAAGLYDGWVFPVSKPGFVGGIVIYGSRETAPTIAENLSTLHLLCTYLHAYMTELDPDSDGHLVISNTLRNREIMGRRSKLSPREITCLRWSAMGKSAEEIAVIEELSTHTVREYLRGAMRKLDSRTQAQAVGRAVKYGVIRI